MIAAVQTRPLEVWGGIECTVNRVGDTYFDQMRMSGHDERISDLDLLADLKLSKVRYPVLWERTAPNGPDSADWSWSDQRLGRLRELGIDPIVGLVHHGSGPRHTSLVDPGFATKFAEYAGAVAARYPWVEDYTPVNEPLTTARFSCLYGHWYPHERSDGAFIRALLNETRATILAMRAIREVNPSARLVQTEDIGKTHSTAALDYQAQFENNRRWLSLDLLCGRIDREHPLHPRLLRWGASESELAWFVENPCPPETIGVNYYLTSERFLDDRLAHYPEWAHGGNGRDSYADVEAVRVDGLALAGHRGILDDVWERYGIPIAITEVHLGCSREEQLRWLLEGWRAAQSAAEAGADVRAVTVWALFGSYDWNSLVTRLDGHYEPGAFDCRAPTPRPTAISEFVASLTSGDPDHPLFDEVGWWQRPTRYFYCLSEPEGRV
jgi:dTDP-4-dehydrorhamnose reductase